MKIKVLEKKDTVATMSESFLFSACPEKLLESVATECEERCFSSGEDIISDGDNCLYIIISGVASVYTRDDSHELLLRTLGAGDTVGVATLFGTEPAVSRILAKEETCVLTVSDTAVKTILSNDSDTALRYISFLSDRIRFLNRRIALLSAGSAERRLAAWLETSSPDSAERMTLPIPMNALASALGLGRASLYRAFDALSDAGYIRREDKDIIFLDREKMLSDCGLS